MSKMIDLIRADAVPASIIQSAARGELSIPDADSLEILVHLARTTRTYGEQAKLDAGRVGRRSAARQRRQYAAPIRKFCNIWAPENLRPSFLMAIMTNPCGARTGPAGAGEVRSTRSRAVDERQRARQRFDGNPAGADQESVSRWIRGAGGETETVGCRRQYRDRAI